MNREESIYGFIANTKATQITSSETIALQNYTNNTNTSNEIVGASIARPQITFPANVNRIVLKIVDTTKYEPIKAKAYYDENVEKIKIEVTYSTNNISKIIDSKGKVLSENSLTADTGDEIIGNKVYKFIIIDNLGNQKEIKIEISGLDIYIIENEEDLKLFQKAVNNNKTTKNTRAYQIADVKMNEGKYTINEETGDISFAEDAEQWTGITRYYYGKYYGNNHTISGIYGTEGLFSYCDGAEIRDLGIINSYITPSSISGAIIENAKNNTILENCYSEATIKSNYDYIGGLIGKAESGTTVKKCYNKGNVSGNGSIGGVIGQASNAKIEDSYNANKISGYTNTAGIVGSIIDNSSIKNCYNMGEITGKSYQVGGISGYISATSISNCYNIANINGKGNYTAGIVGQAYGRYVSISKCYNVGNITNESSDYTGGIVGFIQYYSETNIVSNCYNKGNVLGRGRVGGIAGIGVANYSYNTGEITGTSDNTGGIIGENANKNTTCMYLYNAGNVKGSSGVGGIIGYNHNNNTNYCYNIGNVTGTYEYTGGIVGQHYGSIYYCYNSGVIDGKNYIGGIVGYNSSVTSSSGMLVGTVSSSYYKTGTASKGVGRGTDSGAYATDNMAEILSVVGSYFKNDQYSINNGLPLLSWQTDNDKLNLINANNAFVEDTQGLNGGYPILAWELEKYSQKNIKKT